MPDDSEIFEGDNIDNKKEIALELDLFSLSNKYKNFWKYSEKSDLHQAIFIMISKGLSYEQYNPILKKIYTSLGNNFTKFDISEKKLKEWGLSNEKIQAIYKITKLPEINSKTLCKIREGGIYLIKAFKILQEEDDDIFLAEDYIVRRVLGILYFRTKLMTIPEVKDIAKIWQGHRSQISYFLSRLKDSGAEKILNDEDLTEQDFIGN